MQLFLLLEKMDILPKFSTGKIEMREVLLLYLIILPIYIVLTFIIKKSDLSKLGENYEFEWNKVFNGNVCLIVYLIASIIAIPILMII